MNNLPRLSAGHGPPLKATDAVLVGLFKEHTDHQSMMPLPRELLQFVGGRDPQLADDLYHLKFTDNTSPQGLVGQRVEQFLQNWRSFTATTHGATDGSPSGSPAGAVPASPHSALPAPDVLLMTPMEPVAADVSPPENGMTFTLSAGPAPSSYFPSSPTEPNTPNSDSSPGSPAGSIQYHYLPQRASGVSEQSLPSFPALVSQDAPFDAGAVPRTLLRPETGGHAPMLSYDVCQSVQREYIIVDDPAHVSYADVRMTHGKEAKATPEPELSLDWVTIPSSCEQAITTAEHNLANGMYTEWNKIGISFQLVAGHLNYGHVQPAGAGYVGVMDYIIYHSPHLGILPQSTYSEKDAAQDGRAAVHHSVALRDVRNFWAQFYYFSRSAFTEQLLRTKAIRAVLAQREEKQKREAAESGAAAPAAQATARRSQPYYQARMGPETWWAFGRHLDQDWETYFRHIFSDQTLPAYLRPWFAQTDVRFVPCQHPTEEKAETPTPASPPADETDVSMADEEKENDTPEEVYPNIMSYDTICRMENRLEALHRILYPRDDKPSQGESDNLLPRMFYDKLRSLVRQCTAHHPWKSPDVPVTRVGLRRLNDDHRTSFMDPLEFYSSTD